MNQSNKRIIHVITSNRTMKFKVPNETSANKKLSTSTQSTKINRFIPLNK